jgi:glycosyltransferase involved in cell wall biosynthesis
MIRALHVIPSLSVKHGGPSYAVRAMARALTAHDVDAAIATTDDDGDDARLSVPIGEPIQEQGATVYYFQRNILPYKVSFGLARWLRSNISKFDVVHIHALFSFSSTVSAHFAHRQGVPYVVRPLGVLNRYGLENRRPFLKKITMPLFEFRILRHSAAIHCTSEAEKREAAQISPEIDCHRSVVIPLPVESVKGNAEDFLKRYPLVKNRRVILFLSRVDEKKGIELLLGAFAEVWRRISDTVLVIAGNGTPGYIQQLRERAEGLNIAEHILWTGHLQGEVKAGAFAAADVFVLPSRSENFGIAAAEALAAGASTVVTQTVAIADDIRGYDAGIVVENRESELSDAICRILNDHDLASRLAQKAQILAAERYGINAVGRQLRELYDAILHKKHA